MSLSILVDMNLSPDWIPVLRDHGWPAVHWSSVGDIRAPDKEIMAWALSHDHIVFTHDLDFGTMLALTHAAARASCRSEVPTSCPRR
jgi:predicted nuclease of predicted toxin-antitoxin system